MMQHARTQKPAARQDETSTVEAPADLRDDQLDEDTACCLAEIDEVLAEQVSEREKAEAEFRRINGEWERVSSFLEDSAWSEAFRATNDELRIWQAKYAHLGLSYHECCGEFEMHQHRIG